MINYSLTKLKTFKHALGSKQLTQNDVVGIFSAPTVYIPPVAPVENLAQVGQDWDRFYWLNNKAKYDYSLLAEYIPSSGILVEFGVNPEVSNFAYFNLIGDLFVVDLFMDPEQTKITRNNARLTFSAVIEPGIGKELKFQAFNHKGMPIQKLDPSDPRANPLPIIPTALTEMFVRWFAYVATCHVATKVCVKRKTTLRGKVKPGLMLKSLWEINSKQDILSFSVESIDFINGAKRTLNDWVTTIATDAPFEYWVEHGKASNLLRVKYSKLQHEPTGASIDHISLTK